MDSASPQTKIQNLGYSLFFHAKYKSSLGDACSPTWQDLIFVLNQCQNNQAHFLTLAAHLSWSIFLVPNAFFSLGMYNLYPTYPNDIVLE